MSSDNLVGEEDGTAQVVIAEALGGVQDMIALPVEQDDQQLLLTHRRLPYRDSLRRFEPQRITRLNAERIVELIDVANDLVATKLGR
jgi:hypothetical protein